MEGGSNYIFVGWNIHIYTMVAFRRGKKKFVNLF
jgi:hypothetical protein